MLQPGDLIRDNGDNDLGLVLSEVRSYGLDLPGQDAEFVMVQWSLYKSPQRMVLKAIRDGWVEVISEAEEAL